MRESKFSGPQIGFWGIIKQSEQFGAKFVETRVDFDLTHSAINLARRFIYRIMLT